MTSKHLIPFLFLFLSSTVNSQKLKKEDKQLMSNLKMHIAFLASDKLEGRRTGTEGERLSAEYISTAFKNLGLTPKAQMNIISLLR